MDTDQWSRSGTRRNGGVWVAMYQGTSNNVAVGSFEMDSFTLTENNIMSQDY